MTEAQVKAPEELSADDLHAQVYPREVVGDNSDTEIDDLVKSLGTPEEHNEAEAEAEAGKDTKETEPPAKPREDWKQKYYTLQGKYDAEVPRLSGEIRELKSEMQNLAERTPEVPEVPEQVGHSLITEEEVELYGEDFIDIVGRRAQEIAAQTTGNTVAELRAEIAELKGDVSNTGQRIQRTEQEGFYVKLDRELENWRDINVDPDFVAWLDTEIPETRGMTRKSVLMDAFNSGSVKDTADVFRTYTSAKQGNARTSASNGAGQPAGNATLDLSQYVAPSAGQGSPQGNTGQQIAQKIWTQPEIAAFYTQVRQGKFKSRPDDKAKIEQSIVNASAQGRVR
jgi:molybdopterin converting factor small subunit